MRSRGSLPLMALVADATFDPIAELYAGFGELTHRAY
ncbi:hypothetical protein JOF53_007510 [Crossiella equi]|uniref:Uncharacterized protein n=1 Tax=Crossiella equi TaxID=130796 RepID=A0ABS5APZ8_9PSEU|nr:hypothetical protein [Crossiella equi]